jgi:hypothetical protein
VDPRVKLKSFLREGVAATTALVMLLQHQHLLASARQQSSRRQPADTRTNHNDIKVPARCFQLTRRVSVLENFVPFGLVQLERL